jgi:DNA-binding protein Fis
MQDVPIRHTTPRQQIDLALASLGVAHRGAVRLTTVVEEHLRRVVDACEGNQSLAAELLGIDRNTLARKLKLRRPRTRRRRRKAS